MGVAAAITSLMVYSAKVPRSNMWPFRKKEIQASVTPPSVVPPPGNPGTTKIDREHFLLHAPFQWVAVAGDNPLEFEFRNQTLPEQLIVTVLLTPNPLDQTQLQQVAKDLAEKRLDALRTVSAGHAVHSAPQIQAGPEQAEVRCFGQDDSQKVRFAFLVRAAPAKTVTVALTRYFLDEVGTPFEAYCGIIFDFLQVKDAAGSASP